MKKITNSLLRPLTPLYASHKLALHQAELPICQCRQADTDKPVTRTERPPGLPRVCGRAPFRLKAPQEAVSVDCVDEPDVHPLAIAMAWVGRIFGVVAIMVLPGVIGAWLDRRLGSGWLSLAGMLAGLAAGVSCLILLTGRGTAQQNANQRVKGARGARERGTKPVTSETSRPSDDKRP